MLAVPDLNARKASLQRALRKQPEHRRANPNILAVLFGQQTNGYSLDALPFYVLHSPSHSNNNEKLLSLIYTEIVNISFPDNGS